MKQYNLGRWLGAFKVEVTRTTTYISLVTLGFSMVAAREQLNVWFPWMPFWMLFIVVIMAAVVVGALDYMFIMPAEYDFQNKQSWEHNNPAMPILKGIETKLDTLLEEKK